MKANWVLALVVVFAGLWAGACGGDDSAALRTEVAGLQTQVARPTPTLAAIASVTQPPPSATVAPARSPESTVTRPPEVTAITTPTAAPRNTSTPIPTSFDKLKFLDTLPLPSGAEIVSVVEGMDIGYRTRQSEPAIIALYTNWIAPQGWTKASELPYLQPNERWTKAGYEFVVYITPKGAEGVAVINIQVRPTTVP